MKEEIKLLKIEAESNLESLNVEYIVSISNESVIRFYKDGYLIYIEKLGEFPDNLVIYFRLLVASRFLKKRKTIKQIEEIDYITGLLIGLCKEVKITDNNTS